MLGLLSIVRVREKIKRYGRTVRYSLGILKLVRGVIIMFEKLSRFL